VIAAAQRLASVFAARAAEHDRDASVPTENFALLAEAGLLNLTTPAALGGDGLGTAVVCRVIQEIATGDPATALILAMQYNQHASLGRSHRWPLEVYERFCRESVEGISLVNAARVEPELGTPARGGLPATLAKKTADGWSLTGRKIYTTGAPVLSYAIVWAKTDEDPVRVGSFLLPMNAPGVTIEHTWNHLGMRGTGSDDLVMADVHLPAEYGVDVRTQEEWKTALSDNLGSAQSGLVLSALYNGVAIAARNWLAKYLNERVPTNLGASLSTLPRFQTVMGEIETLLYINERLLFGLAENIDNGVAMKPGEAGIVKTVVTENAIKATAMGLELTGNPGLSRDNPLERHYRDVLCGRIHTPQSDAVFLAAGKTAFGMPSSARA
jgi:alkylation response protein AidB-like acyl-CoA dehydrogenase